MVEYTLGTKKLETRKYYFLSILSFMLCGCSQSVRQPTNTLFEPNSNSATMYHIETKEMDSSYITATVYGLHEGAKQRIIRDLSKSEYVTIKDEPDIVWFQKDKAQTPANRDMFVVVFKKEGLFFTPLRDMKHDFTKYTNSWYLLTIVYRRKESPDKTASDSLNPRAVEPAAEKP